MRNSPMKRRVIGGAVTVLVLGVVGFVYAAWTSSGSGSGYAQAGTAQALTTSDLSGGAFTNKLYPGLSNKDVNIKINNPNSYPVTVTSITGNGTIVADSTHQTAGCGTSSDATDTGVTFADQTGLTISVGANSNTTVTRSAASMSNASVDACQGATFTIPVSISGHSG
jgi:hypothetical protein